MSGTSPGFGDDGSSLCEVCTEEDSILSFVGVYTLPMQLGESKGTGLLLTILSFQTVFQVFRIMEFLVQRTTTCFQAFSPEVTIHMHNLSPRNR
jgi:hypothetical protein